MRTEIYEFVNEYVTRVEKQDLVEINLRTIMEAPSNTCFSEVKFKLLAIKDNDVVETILKLEDDGVLYDYLKMLKSYVKRRKEQNYTMGDIARFANIPLFTVRRYENLHNIISTSGQLKLLKAVGLEIIIK